MLPLKIAKGMNSKSSQKSTLTLAQNDSFFPMDLWTAVGAGGALPTPWVAPAASGGGCVLISAGLACHLTLMLPLHMDCLSASLFSENKDIPHLCPW